MPGPVIAVVTYHLPPGRVTGWSSGAYAVHDLYADAVRRAGGRPVLLPPTLDDPVNELAASFDGFLLVGGGDVDPAAYGADRHPHTSGVDPDRDRLEIELLRAADAGDVPTLAICRGAQVTNVAFGGTLFQHLPDDPDRRSHRSEDGEPERVHQVTIDESSRVAAACGRPVVRGVSRHHQGIDRVGDGLVPVAKSDDGLVEAVERPDGWLLAVQWHPEVNAAEDPTAQGLFDALVRQAGARSGIAGSGVT